jgi:hypothetical protein
MFPKLIYLAITKEKAIRSSSFQLFRYIIFTYPIISNIHSFHRAESSALASPTSISNSIVLPSRKGYYVAHQEVIGVPDSTVVHSFVIVTRHTCLSLT